MPDRQRGPRLCLWICAARCPLKSHGGHSRRCACHPRCTAAVSLFRAGKTCRKTDAREPGAAAASSQPAGTPRAGASRHVRHMSATLFAMNPSMSLRAPTRLDRCAHDARNALAAISAATEVLARDDAPPAVLHKAGAVVARQAHELAERIGELMTHARHGTAESERALVVSDDMHLLARLAGLLSHAGYRIDLAVNTVTGYEALVREQPDFAVIDRRRQALQATPRRPAVRRGVARRIARGSGRCARARSPRWPRGSGCVRPRRRASR